MKWFTLGFTLIISSVKAAEPPLSVEERLERLERKSELPTPKQKQGLFLDGDFLYWKASLDGVAYATTSIDVVSVIDPNQLLNNKFKARSAHFSYDPGFQVALGYRLPYDNSDLSFSWLRFHTKGRDTAHGTLLDLQEHEGDKIINDFIGLINGLQVAPNRAHATAKVNLDVLDTVIGRTIQWSKAFTLRPFFGVRAAWLNIDWDISFTHPIVIPHPFPQQTTDFHVDNRFSAVGLLAGFQSTWNIYSQFGLFASGSAALIYGRSSEKSFQTLLAIPSNTDTILSQDFSAKNSTHSVKAVFDAALGLKWEAKYYKDYSILLRLGYAMSYWPSVTQKTIQQITRLRDRSDLSFQGLIAGARLDF